MKFAVVTSHESSSSATAEYCGLCCRGAFDGVSDLDRITRMRVITELILIAAESPSIGYLLLLGFNFPDISKGREFATVASAFGA